MKVNRSFTNPDCLLSEDNILVERTSTPPLDVPGELANPPYRCEVEQDEEGRIMRKLEVVGEERIVTEYAYDGASRLARVQVNGRVTEDYRYDDKGRRSFARLPETSSGQAGRYPRGLSFKYRDGDRLGGVGLGIKLEYDHQGRTVHYHTGGPELAYDAVDIEYADLRGPRGMQASIDLPTRLTYTETRLEALRQKKARFATDPRYQDKQAKSGQAESKRIETKVVTYTYDEDAMRRSKMVGDRTVAAYSWLDPFRLAAMRTPWSREFVRFHYADNARLPYAATCQGTALYLFYDHIGSLRVVANSNGHIVREIEYESFGHIVRDTNPGLHLGYGFAGGLHDPDTGFVRFWVRDYDPTMGRFLSPDPAWRGGKPGRKAEERARTEAEAGAQVVDPDRYGYCLDDPVNMTDPTGMGTGMSSSLDDNSKMAKSSLSDGIGESKQRRFESNSEINNFIGQKVQENYEQEIAGSAYDIGLSILNGAIIGLGVQGTVSGILTSLGVSGFWSNLGGLLSNNLGWSYIDYIFNPSEVDDSTIGASDDAPGGASGSSSPSSGLLGGYNETSASNFSFVDTDGNAVGTFSGISGDTGSLSLGGGESTGLDSTQSGILGGGGEGAQPSSSPDDPKDTASGLLGGGSSDGDSSSSQGGGSQGDSNDGNWGNDWGR